MQIASSPHHVTLAQPLLGIEGAGFLVSAKPGGSAFVGRLILARIRRWRVGAQAACMVMIAQPAALLSLGALADDAGADRASLVYGYGIGTTLRRWVPSSCGAANSAPPRSARPTASLRARSADVGLRPGRHRRAARQLRRLPARPRHRRRRYPHRLRHPVQGGRLAARS